MKATKAQSLLLQIREAEGKKKYSMNKTYETWDEDALEAGDTDDKGFEYEDKEFDSLWDMAREIRDGGATESSDSHSANPHTWYSTPDGNQNYRTGETTYYSYHPNKLDQEEAEQLYKLVKMSHQDFSKADPDNMEDDSDAEEDQADALEKEREKKNARLPFD